MSAPITIAEQRRAVKSAMDGLRNGNSYRGKWDDPKMKREHAALSLAMQALRRVKERRFHGRRL